jgi:hypothetical protein
MGTGASEIPGICGAPLRPPSEAIFGSATGLLTVLAKRSTRRERQTTNRLPYRERIKFGIPLLEVRRDEFVAKSHEGKKCSRVVRWKPQRSQSRAAQAGGFPPFVTVHSARAARFVEGRSPDISFRMDEWLRARE